MKGLSDRNVSRGRHGLRRCKYQTLISFNGRSVPSHAVCPRQTAHVFHSRNRVTSRYTTAEIKDKPKRCFWSTKEISVRTSRSFDIAMTGLRDNSVSTPSYRTVHFQVYEIVMFYPIFCRNPFIFSPPSGLWSSEPTMLPRSPGMYTIVDLQCYI